ncbi:MAG: hypothetical protein IKD45_02720, partial [Clostridia bacterium]|nr:hypothetical protein [Clostridia bacterium]
NAAISLISTTNSAQGFAFYQGYSEDVNVSTSNDTLTTDKELKYVLTGAEISSESVYASVDGVDCVLKRASADGDTVCYKLYPKALLGYNINTSVSLWSNLVYNIYVPKIGTHSFTVNGEVPTFSIYTDKEGVEFYHIAISIPAGEALEDIRIRINVISGNTTVPASYTLNVLEYAEAVIAGDHTEVTKTLMKAMLAYAHSAHTYFENTESVSDKLARIDALLADYEAPMPEIKESKTPTASYFDTVEIHLGAVPSFRFYLGSGYTKDNFTFASGGKSVSVKAGTGSDGKAYLEIAMYAYMMLDDVTYTVNGTDITEAYNIFSYLDYAENTLKDESVVEIVKALMGYSECAARYRAEILADKTA